MLHIKDFYQQALDARGYKADPAQVALLPVFERMYRELRACHPDTAFKCWWRKKFPKRGRVKGLYLWGGVGIGKTFMMDLFYDAIPFARKRRIHFHRFMQQVHQDLARLQGRADPLKIIAREFSIRADVLCFDEFFVREIADAMLLGSLLKALFERGVCIVATSNTAPRDLYKNGLQRSQFLPAIDAIEEHCEVVELSSDEDYRVLTLRESGIFFHPLDAKAETAMMSSFELFANHGGQPGEVIEINDRTIPTINCSERVAWFDFSVLCTTPRSKHDYLALTERFNTIMLSRVPEIKPHDDTSITYFINLIDILYDNQVRFLMSSAVPFSQIYTEGKRFDAFKRTQSRLHEMQSTQFLHICDHPAK